MASEPPDPWAAMKKRLRASASKRNHEQRTEALVYAWFKLMGLRERLADVLKKAKGFWIVADELSPIINQLDLDLLSMIPAEALAGKGAQA